MLLHCGVCEGAPCSGLVKKWYGRSDFIAGLRFFRKGRLSSLLSNLLMMSLNKKEKRLPIFTLAWLRRIGEGWDAFKLKLEEILPKWSAYVMKICDKLKMESLLLLRTSSILVFWNLRLKFRIKEKVDLLCSGCEVDCTELGQNMA